MRLLVAGLSPGELAGRTLWHDLLSTEFLADWNAVKFELRHLNQNWEVWINWYEARLDGARANAELEASRAMISRDIWAQGPEVVNAEIQRLIDLHEPKRQIPPPASREQLVEMASPRAVINDEGKLDAAPNVEFDAPDEDARLRELPIRQITLIESIRSGLPGNAPAYFSASLGFYRDELVKNDVRPMLGLLKDHATIIFAAAFPADAGEEWLPGALTAGMEQFRANHTDLLTHFPLDTKRDEIYAATPLNEEEAAGEALTEPIKAVDDAAAEAHEEGQIGDALRDAAKANAILAEVVAHQIPAAQAGAGKSPPELVADPSERPDAEAAQPGLKKRLVFRAIGLYGGITALAASHVTILAHPKVAALVSAAEKALAALLRLFP